jgi:hypothetical protein
MRGDMLHRLISAHDMINEAVVRLDDSEIAIEFNIEFNIERADLDDLSRAKLLSLRAEFTKATKLVAAKMEELIFVEPTGELALESMENAGHSPAELIHNQYEQTFGAQEPSGITGAVQPVERLDEDRLALCTDMRVAEAGRRLIVDKQLLDLTIGHQPGGLVDCGKSEMEAWQEQVDALLSRETLPAMGKTSLALQREIEDSFVRTGELVQQIIELSEGEPAPNTVLVPDTPAGREAAERIRQLNEEHGFGHLNELSLVPGTPIQVALGYENPHDPGDISMVMIIGYTETKVGRFWVSDHGVMWARGLEDGEVHSKRSGRDMIGPITVDLLPQVEVDRGSWDLTPEVDAALAKHFDGAEPLTQSQVTEAEQRARAVSRGSRP